MDYDAAQRHRLNTMLSQSTLAALSDDPGQPHQDPMLALINQAWRAREGHDEGMSYFTVQF